MTRPLLGRGRIRFQAFSFQRLDDGRCQSRVEFSWADHDDVIVGEAEGLSSPTGDLRCAASAALDALGQVAREEGLSFKLLGVKAVKAFDSSVVIIALSVSRPAEDPMRLVGAYLTDADVTRGAAVAVLNATNRYLGNYFQAS